VSTHEGNVVTGVNITNSSSPDRIPVLFTGGVHPRELVPPDALVSFCDRLLTAFAGNQDVSYQPFADPSGVVYQDYVVSAARIRSILDRIDLYVVPCVNPDGRDFTLSSNAKLQREWRKNRRPDPGCPGVDLNRNFAITWDSETYFSSTAAPKAHVSDQPCSELFRGYTDARPPLIHETEPETQNLIDLVAEKGIAFLVDVHMFGRTILFPWGMETNQSNDLTKTFINPLFDRTPGNPNGGRDGLTGTAYAEYLPDTFVDPRGQLLTRLIVLADTIAAEISRSAGSDPTAIARSVYTPKQSVGLYPTTGAFDDFTFSRQFLDPALDNIHTFTLECGNEIAADPNDDDGGFWPDSVTQFPKVEREVHAALFGLLSAI
jgi:hypothetical protein